MRFPVYALAIFLLAACGGGGDDGAAPRSTVLPNDDPGLAPFTTVAPENTGDGWQTSTPEAQGMDEGELLAMLDALEDGEYPGVDSVVIAKNDTLIAEGYFNGFGRESLHDLRSASKSITSALAGLAIQQQLITVDDPISMHFANFESHDNVDERKRAITVFHLLNMNSGLECDDSDSSSPGNEERMYPTADWIDFMLDLRMAYAPGEVASYCTGGVVLLGNIIGTRSGMGLDGFAQAYLFDPLAIRELQWRRSPDGQATGGGMLHLRPRDAAKFGNVFVNDGVWNGVRVMPHDWVEESRRRITSLSSIGYGQLWWKRQFIVRGAQQECFFAAGNGGNYIFVLPSEHLVVVFTASNYNSVLSDLPFDVLSLMILPAVR